MTQSLLRQLTIVGLVSLLPTGSFAYTGQKLAGTAKVTIEQARSIALKAPPGGTKPQRSWRKKKAAADFAIRSGSRAAKPSTKSVWTAKFSKTRKRVGIETSLLVQVQWSCSHAQDNAVGRVSRGICRRRAATTSVLGSGGVDNLPPGCQAQISCRSAQPRSLPKSVRPPGELTG
jgi:hypothetical protein